MRFKSIVSAALAAAFSASCSDSTAPTIPLSDEEVAQLFAQVMSAASGAIEDEPPALRAANGTPSNVTTTVTVSAECEGGGTVVVSGTATDNTTSASFDVTESFSSCVSDPFTVDGSLRYYGNMTMPDADTFTMQATLSGRIDVVHTDGRTGSCPVNFTMNISSTASSANFSASGSICGRDASAVMEVSG